MKRYNIVLLSTIAILATGARAEMSSKEKAIWTIGGGCVAGGGIGAYLDSRDTSPKKSPTGTIASSALIGCLTGALWSWFFQDDREGKVFDELAKYKSMDRNEGRMLLDETLLTKGPDRSTCTGEVRYGLLWPGKDGKPASAGEPQIAYLSSKLAVQYIAFYSFDGCFPGPYTKAPDLKLYMESIFKEPKP